GLERAEEPVERLGVGVPENDEVEAAAEDRRRGGCQDEAADGVVLLGPAGRVGERTGELEVERVRLPARKGKDAHAVLVGDADERVRHAALRARATPARKRSRTRRSSVSSGWNVAARTFPLLTRTGSEPRRARTSTEGPTRVSRGARMQP